MKVIKKINNNVALCLDNNNHEVIAFGKGIGFPEMPYILEDLSLISKTFYGAASTYANLLQEIPKEIIDISNDIVDYALRTLSKEINENILFTLADHIHFAMTRFQKNIYVRAPYMGDINYLYPEEMKIGIWSIEHINKTFNIKLPKEEATSIALHIINSEMIDSQSQSVSEEMMIEEITKIIEKHFMFNINRDSFNYYRFISHMQYLIKRLKNHEESSSKNENLYESLKNEYAEADQCAYLIKEYIYSQMNQNLEIEDIVYLMIHINRLCSKENKQQENA